MGFALWWERRRPAPLDVLTPPCNGVASVLDTSGPQTTRVAPRMGRSVGGLPAAHVAPHHQRAVQAERPHWPLCSSRAAFIVATQTCRPRRRRRGELFPGDAGTRPRVASISRFLEKRALQINCSVTNHRICPFKERSLSRPPGLYCPELDDHFLNNISLHPYPFKQSSFGFGFNAGRR